MTSDVYSYLRFEHTRTPALLVLKINYPRLDPCKLGRLIVLFACRYMASLLAR